MDDQKKKNSINYTYLLHTRRQLLIAIGFALTSVMVGIFFLFPNVTKLQDAYSQLKKEEKKLEQLETKRDLLQRIDSTDLYAKKDQVNAILPSLKPVLPLLKEIERVSGETGIIISEASIVPGQISTSSAEVKRSSSKALATLDKDMDVIETKLVLIGRVENINAFLQGINKITPLTETTELTLKAANRQNVVPGQETKEEDKGVFEATLTLTSYFYLGRPQAKVDQALPTAGDLDDATVAQLDTFNIPPQSAIPANLTIQGGGKEDLFQ